MPSAEKELTNGKIKSCGEEKVLPGDAAPV
jgi:hypothetical protein